jgi:drug/metabolite transporter (DMT)-like permease
VFKNKSVWIGIAAGLASTLIAAAWQIATRYGVTSSLAPVDLAFLRYTVPALLLLPVLWRHGLVPKNAHHGWYALLIAGGGLPFGLLAMTGAVYAPAAHMGVLLAGTMPLFTAALFFVVSHERVNTRRSIGYALILVGALLFGVFSARFTLGATWLGDALFLCASLLWGFYTLAFRRLALSPWHATAVVSFWSSLIAIAWIFASGQSRLLSAPINDVILQIVMQGGIAGVMGLWIYSVAINRLGPDNASVFGALVPVLSAVAGWLILSETMSASVAATIAIVVVGVLLASRWQVARATP